MKLIQREPELARHEKDLGRVLITDGGPGQARSTLAAVRALAAAGYKPSVSVSGPNSLAGASRWCERKVTLPRAGDPSYAERVMEEAGNYLTVLPASDASLVALGFPGADLVDKAILYRRAVDAGIAIPSTHSYESGEDLAKAASRLSYPVVVKPSLKLTIAKGQSARLVRSPAELARLKFGDEPVVVQEYVQEPLRALCGVMWNGRLVASVHQRYLRTWPTDCGTAAAAETAEPDLVLEERITRLLSSYSGIFQAQFAGSYLLDLNPRIYGSLPLAVASGVNLPAIMCDLVKGLPPTEVTAKPGSFYRWIEGDLRHALHNVRNGGSIRQSLRALRPRRGTAHSTESLVDPLPMVLRARHALSKDR